MQTSPDPGRGGGDTPGDKLERILACPACKHPSLGRDDAARVCRGCGARYPLRGALPLLIPPESPVHGWYGSRPTPRRRLRNALYRLRPSERVWTRRSMAVLERVVRESRPDDPDSVVVLIGAGYEPLYRRLLADYRQIVRVGLAHEGDVDAACDLCWLPIQDSSVDLLLSSSVLEHVYAPEKAVAEIHRVLKPGGRVYAEIPFLRPYHMAPVDYQRYTISGIEVLFARHGFTLREKGICSGPFTAWALYMQDLVTSLFGFNRALRFAAVLATSLLLHPVKFLDRTCETAEWATFTACNFFYSGTKPAPDTVP